MRGLLAPAISLFVAGTLLAACGGGGGGGASAVTPAVGATSSVASVTASSTPAPGATSSPSPGATSHATATASGTAVPSGMSTATATLAPTAIPTGAVTSTPNPGAIIAGEMPRSSDAFVDTAGVNLHLSYSATLYGTNFPLIAARLTSLGLRHIRDGAAIGQTNVCSELAQLGSAGIHLDVLSSPALSASDLAGYAACSVPSIDAIEGPNEYDTAGPSNWAAALQLYQPLVYGEAHALGLPAISPSLINAADYAAVGSLFALSDYGNMHDYFSGHNPGTPGWGGVDQFGMYGSIGWNINVAAQEAGSRPTIATETGYPDSGDTYSVPAATKARYTLRTLLEHWNAGVIRTYFYELVDEGGAPFAHYGLIDASGNAKPAYTALRNLLQHDADPGGSPLLTPLPYTLTAATTVHHSLMQKRNGSYVLTLWNEVAEWNPDTASTIAVTPLTVALAFATTPSAIVLNTFDDNGNITASSIGGRSAIAITVTGSPTIIDITR